MQAHAATQRNPHTGQQSYSFLIRLIPEGIFWKTRCKVLFDCDLSLFIYKSLIDGLLISRFLTVEQQTKINTVSKTWLKRGCWPSVTETYCIWVTKKQNWSVGACPYTIKLYNHKNKPSLSVFGFISEVTLSASHTKPRSQLHVWEIWSASCFSVPCFCFCL